MSGIPAIVWDLDGTLIDSAGDLAAALNVLLRERGLSSHSIGAVKSMIGGGVAQLLERGFLAAGAPITSADAESVVGVFMEVYSELALEETSLFDGAVETLDLLSDAGYVHGICTNKPYGITTEIITGLNIADRFAAVVGGDSTSSQKPHSEPLRTCLEQMQVATGHAIMVGDSAADVGVGRALGLPVVLVSFGYSPVPVAELGADAVVNHLTEIPMVLDKLASMT